MLLIRGWVPVECTTAYSAGWVKQAAGCRHAFCVWRVAPASMVYRPTQQRLGPGSLMRTHTGLCGRRCCLLQTV